MSDLKNVTLKYWFALDKAFLEGVNKDEDNYKEYLSNKAALISNVVEMQKFYKYTPEIKVESSDELTEQVNTCVKECKEFTESVISDNKDVIFSEIQEACNDSKEIAAKMYNDKFNEILVDSILMKDFIDDKFTNEQKTVNDILYGAYKMLRESFLKCL